MRRTGKVVVVLALVAVVLATADHAPATAAEPDMGFATGYGGPVADAVFDPAEDLVYVAVPSTADADANSVVAFDPDDGAIEWSVFVGSGPQELALADDGSVLYVGLGGSNAITRVDLSTRTVDLEFSLGSGDSGPRYAEDIEVLPGAPETVVVSLYLEGRSPRHDGVAVFDDGVMRPDVSQGHTGANVIEAASATTVYGFTNETTNFGFRTLEVGPTGIDDIDAKSTSISGFGTDIELFDGRIYSSTGRVIDPTTGNDFGTFELGRPFASVAPAFADGHAYLVDGGDSATVRAFDLSTFAATGTPVVLATTDVDGILSTSAGLLVWNEAGFVSPTAPTGFLEGTVVDEILGAPIHSLCVVAVGETVLYEAVTDQNGAYRMEVDAGTYYVLFAECEFFEYFSEWHDDRVAFDTGNATAVVVGADSTVVVDAALVPVFLDVARDSTFFIDTVWIRDRGITTGCGPVTYCPTERVTREQMAAFLARLWRFYGNTCPGVSHPFTDVPGTSFASADVACIYGLGITTGTSSTQYSPKDFVTREQMAAFLARFAREVRLSCDLFSHPFTDVSRTSFAYADVACIFGLGITTGTSPSQYSPNDFVTREQMAAFLARTGRLVEA